VKIESVDASVIETLIKLPENIYWFAGDEPEGYVLPDMPGSIYVLAYDDDTLGGFAFQPMNRVTFHVHTVFDPVYRGKPADAARLAREYFWAHSLAETVFALVPSDNKPALVLAGMSGMKHGGRLERALRRGDAFADFVLFQDHRPWHGLHQ
jgi:RimJ/RimL family protein N-acetyltransferase